MKTKICSRCRAEKELVEFRRNKSYKDGYDAYCRDCRWDYQRKWNKEHKEHRRAYSRRRGEEQKIPCPRCGNLMWYTSLLCIRCSSMAHGKRLANRLREWWADDPGGKKRHAASRRQRTRWQDPSYRQKMQKTSRELAEGRRGKSLSEEHRLAISEGLRQSWAQGKWDGRNYNEESRRKASETVKRLWRSGRYDEMIANIAQNPTNLELDLFRGLDQLDIDYTPYYRPEGCSYVFDAYIPSLNTLVEADGEHWHYSEWAEEQGVPRKDARKSQWAVNHGYSVTRIRERDVESRGMMTCLAEQLFEQLPLKV